MISANLAAIFYLVSGILFILALRGLSSPDTSRQGNYFGIAGMIIAIVVTFLSIGNFSTSLVYVIIFLVIALGLSCAFIVINFILSPKNPDPEKLSAYECGFEPFQDSRMEFDVRFYLVAILFIIFDLEIAFLFPWAISLGNIGILGFTSMMIFLFILTVGFIYEWKKGALDWE